MLSNEKVEFRIGKAVSYTHLVKILMDRIQGRETEEERDIRLPVTLITRKSVMVQEREK